LETRDVVVVVLVAVAVRQVEAAGAVEAGACRRTPRAPQLEADGLEVALETPPVQAQVLMQLVFPVEGLKKILNINTFNTIFEF
jgi:hypothetical protein